jgi:hypothetical protein
LASVVLSVILAAIISGMVLYSKRETMEEEKVLDTEAPISSDILVEPNPVRVNVPVVLSAKLDDLATGGSEIASAEYSLDGASWYSMAAADGALDSPTEKVVSRTSVKKSGVYRLMVRGSDDRGNTTPEKSVVLIVYDPDNGYVKGEGSIDSLLEAYSADRLLKGKATFRFVCKYEKNASTPSGKVEFAFAPANLVFVSSSFEWLVVSGAKAHCKGTGKINDSGDFGFTLIAVDGKLRGEGEADKFRIKIWDKTTGKITYDNGVGGPEEILPTTSISGGKITIKMSQSSV